MSAAHATGAPSPHLTLTRPGVGAAPWLEPASWWELLTATTAHLETPFGILSVEALAANAFDLLDRAQGTPIRVASKSVRVRAVLDAVLALPGYAGILAYTLPEALWLASPEGGAHPDVVVGYPSVDRTAIARLAADETLASRVTLMLDDVAQLDLIDAAVSPAHRPTLRICLELDASFRAPLLGHLGVRRSPLHTAAEARAFAATITARAGFRLVGVMGYEAQIAGVTNKGSGKVAVRAMQKASARELAERRGAAIAAIREVTELEFVNGGGTGSLESTHADGSVTEIAAGSGLFGPHLFDGYTQFTPAPAAAFALSVVRRPTPRGPRTQIATLLGGGWIASGPTQPDRQPQLVWPAGLSMLPREAAGEVQTPVTGEAARDLSVGDRVWLRHTKAGELSEHLNAFALVEGSGADAQVVGEVPTYRGEGKAFL